MSDRRILDATKGDQLWLPCSSCNRRTRQSVLRSAARISENDAMCLINVYELVECQGCDQISFRQHNLLKHKATTPSGSDSIASDTEYLYPPRIAGRLRLKDSYNLPSQIRQIYSETHQALCNTQHILTGMGIRALIEAVCKEKAATESSLQQKIDSLLELGVLTLSGAQIFHSLRIMGN
jgi:hypothetical protein